MYMVPKIEERHAVRKRKLDKKIKKKVYIVHIYVLNNK